jgi:colanic acid biosynthesis glycosyl transferase WcaI
MKILLYGLNYPPDLIGVAKYSGEMATWLAARGHKVRMVTAPPYYPEWRIKHGYSAWRYRREKQDGVEILRCPLWVRPGLGGIRRILHLLSFALGSALPLLWQAGTWRPDVVLLFAPTLLCGPATLMAAKIGGAASWLHVQDFEIDAAFDLGFVTHGRARRWAMAFERFLFHRFDRISTITAKMCERARSKGAADDKVVLFPNWADFEAIRPLDGQSPFRAELDLAEDDLVALYSGNLGFKQGLETLVEATRLLAATPSLKIVIAGDGAARPYIEQHCRLLANCRLLPLQPIERLNDLLNAADMHLMPQRADAADLVMPSKLLGMMASGRPVIAGVHPGTQLYDAVFGCGLVIPPEDASALAEAMITLARTPELRSHYGRAARLRASSLWEKEVVLQRFEESLKTLAGRAEAERRS